MFPVFWMIHYLQPYVFHYNFYNITVAKIGILDFAVHTAAVHDSIHSKYVQCWDLRYTYNKINDVCPCMCV